MKPAQVLQQIRNENPGGAAVTEAEVSGEHRVSSFKNENKVPVRAGPYIKTPNLTARDQRAALPWRRLDTRGTTFSAYCPAEAN